ncbi:hypothetical protein PF004_g21732, partial [Phytophthora fragariae]
DIERGGSDGDADGDDTDKDGSVWMALPSALSSTERTFRTVETSVMDEQLQLIKRRATTHWCSCRVLPRQRTLHPTSSSSNAESSLPELERGRLSVQVQRVRLGDIEKFTYNTQRYATHAAPPVPVQHTEKRHARRAANDMVPVINLQGCKLDGDRALECRLKPPCTRSTHT